MILPKSLSERAALGGVPGAHARICVLTTDPGGARVPGDEGMTVRMMAKIIALCGVVLMLSGCGDPSLSCSGNGGMARNSGALCAGKIPLNW